MKTVYILIMVKNGKDTIIAVYTNEYDAQIDGFKHEENDKANGFYNNHYRVDEYPMYDEYQSDNVDDIHEDSKYD